MPKPVGDHVIPRTSRIAPISYLAPFYRMNSPVGMTQPCAALGFSSRSRRAMQCTTTPYSVRSASHRLRVSSGVRWWQRPLSLTCPPDTLHAWCGAHLLRDLKSLYDFEPGRQDWAQQMAALLIQARDAAAAARQAGQAPAGSLPYSLRSLFNGHAWLPPGAEPSG